jgi:cation transport ATPase
VRDRGRNFSTTFGLLLSLTIAAAAMALSSVTVIGKRLGLRIVKL